MMPPSPAEGGAPDPATAALFAGVPTSMISDNLCRLQGANGIRPFHRGAPMAGRALTVRTCAGDNLAIHQALELVRPGDVIVVDGGGDTSRALAGEIIVAIAVSRKAAGLVIDGAIRDSASIASSDFPCFAKGISHRGPYKNGPGELNVTVSVGGMIVSPGDIVVGDSDGVVAFAAGQAETLLKAVRAQEQREAEILRDISEGRYRGAYGQ
jgi:RraA family protein